MRRAGTPRICCSRRRRRATSSGICISSEAGIRVLAYVDNAEGTMVDSADEGRFTEIVLRPHVTIQAGDDRERAEHLHHDAHAKCYIANSVNFPIRCEPVIEFAAA